MYDELNDQAFLDLIDRTINQNGVDEAALIDYYQLLIAAKVRLREKIASEKKALVSIDTAQEKLESAQATINAMQREASAILDDVRDLRIMVMGRKS